MSSFTRVLASALCVMFASFVSTSVVLGAENPILSGQWVMNSDLSDKPGVGVDPSGDGRGGGRRGRPGGPNGPSGPPPGRGGGGGFGGFGGRGGPEVDGRQESEAERARRRALAEELMKTPVRFTLIQANDVLRILEPDGVARSYAINGKDEKHQLSNGTITTNTRWSEGVLVMDLEAGDQLKIRRSFRLRDESPRRLEVSTGPAGRRERGLVTVYDLAE